MKRPKPRPALAPRGNNIVFKANLIVAAVDGRVTVLKDRYHEVKKQKVLNAICRLISTHIVGERYKMFMPAFEKDLEKAINDVIEKHHLEKIQKGE